MNVLIISVTSGIGEELSKRYTRDGHIVVGTYRNKPESSSADCLIPCDIDDTDSVDKFISTYYDLELPWDTLIMCPCNPLPAKPFFDCDFDEWSTSVNTNSINQLRLIHKLYELRSGGLPNIVLFAAGGINNSVVDFSAYTISKIMLVKMCEFIDSENENLNIFSVGPGWTKTKIHDIIVSNSTGKKREETLRFIESGEGTSVDDIYNCIVWLCNSGKVVSGRNFSVINDRWGSQGLLDSLNKDNNMYKLRRFGNESR